MPLVVMVLLVTAASLPVLLSTMRPVAVFDRRHRVYLDADGEITEVETVVGREGESGRLDSEQQAQQAPGADPVGDLRQVDARDLPGGQVPTEVGLAYYDRARSVLAEASEALAESFDYCEVAYAAMADENRVSPRLVAPTRGLIVDRFGVPLAVNQKTYRPFEEVREDILKVWERDQRDVLGALDGRDRGGGRRGGVVAFEQHDQRSVEALAEAVREHPLRAGLAGVRGRRGDQRRLHRQHGHGDSAQPHDGQQQRHDPVPGDRADPAAEEAAPVRLDVRGLGGALLARQHAAAERIHRRPLLVVRLQQPLTRVGALELCAQHIGARGRARLRAQLCRRESLLRTLQPRFR